MYLFKSLITLVVGTVVSTKCNSNQMQTKFKISNRNAGTADKNKSLTDEQWCRMGC